MDQNSKEQLDQAFQRCKEIHMESVKLHRIVMVLGPIAIVICGAMGVWKAFESKPIWAFIEFFLCLFNVKMLCENHKVHKESERDWAITEARHQYLMEHWEELTGNE